MIKHKHSRDRKGMIHYILLYLTLFFSMFVRNFNRLRTIIFKNFKVLVRSKSSALILILGPLLIIGLVGLAFSTTGVQDIHLGVYSDSYSELSESIIASLMDDSYSVEKTVLQEECVEGVKKGDYNLCLVFDSDMQAASKNNQISFYVDQTRVNLVYAVMDNIGKKVSASSNDLSLGFTQILINKVDNSKQVIGGDLSILKVLLTSTEDLETKTIAAKEGLNVKNITTDLGKLGYETFEEDYEDLIGYLNDQNITSSKITDANNSLNELELELIDYLVETEKATGAMEDASDALSGIAPTLNTNKKKIKQVKESLDTLNIELNSIKVTNGSDIVSPIVTNIEPVITEDTYLGKMFPTFLVLVILFVSIILGSTLVLNEKSANAHFRNFVTPTSDIIFIAGTYITSLIMLIIQMFIVLAVSAIFLSKEILINFWPALYPLFLISTIFILMGICIGYLFNSNETANLASLFIISASLFFSNTILPLETIPEYLKYIINLNPFVIAEGILKKVILFGMSINDVIVSTWKLWGFVILFVLLAFLFMKIYKKKLKG